MNDLFYIADAILDTSAEEWRSINLASPAAVADYASNGLDMDITDAEAERIYEACHKWLAEGSGTQDYFNMVQQPLTE